MFLRISISRTIQRAHSSVLHIRQHASFGSPTPPRQHFSIHTTQRSSAQQNIAPRRDHYDDDDGPFPWGRLLLAGGLAVALIGGTMAVEQWQQKRREAAAGAAVNILDSHPTPFIDSGSDIITIHFEKNAPFPRLQQQFVNIFQYLSLEIGRYPALYGIIGANLGVFILARLGVISPQSFMRNFVLSKQSLSLRNAHTMVTHMFAHATLPHIGLNMYGLYLMAPTLIEVFGTPTFLAFYLACGYTSAIGSMVVHALTRSNFRSLGASGAVFAVLAASFAIRPDDSRLRLIFLPWFSFDPKIFFPLYLLGEIIYNFSQKRVKLDTGAHVSGAIAGYLVLSLLRNMNHNQSKRTVAINTRQSFYLGEMVRYRKEGNGMLIMPNLVYGGAFSKDKFHGAGMLINPTNRKMVTGWFKEGNYVHDQSKKME